MKLEAIKLVHTVAWYFAWQCPLTAIAARYTSDRRDNFDIDLPEWLARENKRIFGGLYLGGVVFAIGRWIYS